MEHLSIQGMKTLDASGPLFLVVPKEKLAQGFKTLKSSACENRMARVPSASAAKAMFNANTSESGEMCLEEKK